MTAKVKLQSDKKFKINRKKQSQKHRSTSSQINIPADELTSKNENRQADEKIKKIKL